MTRKYFGTDGIRGRVGRGAITPEFVLRLGWAAGRVFAGRKTGNNLILIGKDTRISGYMFESALEAGLIAAGVDVRLLGPMPTPAVAYLTRTFQADAGIVISASHNPFYDNGIKFFSGEGEKLPDEVELAIESLLDAPINTDEKLGKARRIVDAAGRYIEFCKGTVPWGFNLSGMKLVLDCANGATYHIAPSVFQELGAAVTAISTDPDGENINRSCGSTDPARLRESVVTEGADLGIAFDGDGDRVIFVDHEGEVVDGDELLYLIALDRSGSRGGCSGVVGTLMTNYGFELAMREMGIPFERANVGDRYVLEKMKQHQWELGGESSGHIICSDVTTTGDGIVSALQVLMAVVHSGRPLSELKRGMFKFPQTMINVKVTDSSGLERSKVIAKAVADAEFALDGAGRVLLRPSGTEPVVRVMVEGRDDHLVKRLTAEIAEVVERELA